MRSEEAVSEQTESPLQKLQRPSPLRELAYERLRRELLPGGSLHGVDRLVERELADRFAMSRTPIRDALRRLALGGIVIPLTTGGYARRRVTLREVEELHELLSLLEPVAVRMAAAREPAVIKELLGSEAVTSRDPSPIANARFHIALAEASGNVVLSRVVATLNERLVAEHQLVEPGGAPAALADGHELIIDALRNRDPDAAEAAMRRHIELGRDLLSRRIRSAGPDA
jgi:DNA-binding GntR family transcriptional regulator